MDTIKGYSIDKKKDTSKGANQINQVNYIT